MNKENNGWINVKDQLPNTLPHAFYGDKSGKLLLYGQDDSGFSPHIFLGFMANGTFYSDTWGPCDPGQVTHWQPLPTPPTK